MSGSSLRNAVHRRNHKERSQPLNRQKLGFLEKHKDYVARAKDHHLKRDRLKRLREIAALRNKDEFNFGMIRGHTEKGVHINDRGNEALDNDVVALLKTQDAGYIRAQIMAEKRRVDALISRIAPGLPSVRTTWLENKEQRREALQRAGLIKADALQSKKGKAKEPEWTYDEFADLEEQGDEHSSLIGGQGKKTIWADDVDEVRNYRPSSKAAAGLDEEAEDLGVTREERLVDEEARKSSSKAGERHLGYLITELASRQNRLEKLTSAAEKLGIVKALMTTKGQSARRVSERKSTLTEAVISGKVTANGLAMPGFDSQDEDEDESGSKKEKRRIFKWSKERKR